MVTPDLIILAGPLHMNSIQPSASNTSHVNNTPQVNPANSHTYSDNISDQE